MYLCTNIHKPTHVHTCRTVSGQLTFSVACTYTNRSQRKKLTKSSSSSSSRRSRRGRSSAAATGLCLRRRHTQQFDLAKASLSSPQAHTHTNTHTYTHRKRHWQWQRPRQRQRQRRRQREEHALPCAFASFFFSPKHHTHTKTHTHKDTYHTDRRRQGFVTAQWFGKPCSLLQFVLCVKLQSLSLECFVHL